MRRDVPVEVAINASLDPRAAGGVQANLVSLTRTIRRDDSRINLRLLTLPALVAEWQRATNGIRVDAWPFPLRWYREVKGQRWQAFRERAANVLGIHRRRHDEFLRTAGVEVVHFPHQLAFPTRLPFLYEPWDLQHVYLPEFFSPGERRWRERMYGWACRHASLVVTATATTKRQLVEHFRLRPERILVIYRDSELARQPPDPPAQDEILARLGVPEGFALYTAMTFAHKNHLRLFEAMAILRSRYGVRLPLVLTGRRVAGRDAIIEEALHQFDLRGAVHHVGVVSEDELATLFCRARFMVFPSLFEGLGLPLLEAMHQNLPIAAARASCIPETVGDAALLFDPLDPASIAEAMQRLDQDNVLRAQLVAAGRSQIARFRNARARETFFAAYRHVAGAPLTPEEVVLLEEARNRHA